MADAKPVPKGFSFNVSDLLLASSWASAGKLTMLVRLDHGSEDEEYEEVLEFRTHSRAHFILWNDGTTVFTQPLPGKMQMHGSVAEALECLRGPRDICLTDIKASSWPVD